MFLRNPGLGGYGQSSMCSIRISQKIQILNKCHLYDLENLLPGKAVKDIRYPNDAIKALQETFGKERKMTDICVKEHHVLPSGINPSCSGKESDQKVYEVTDSTNCSLLGELINHNVCDDVS